MEGNTQKDLGICFVDGFAQDWAFALPESFRSSLDIKWAPRVVNKTTEYQWVQGEYYSFSTGDIIYDTPLAYKNTWAEALTHIKRFAQIIKATPAAIINGEYSPGFVEFKIYKPNTDATGIEVAGSFSCTQVEFVTFLKFGTLKGIINE